MKTTHLIFDMDGTLINTVLYTVPAAQRAARELGLPVPTDERAIDAIGYAAEEFFDVLIPGQPESARTAYRERMRELEHQGAAALGAGIAFPGAAEALKALHEGGAQLHLISAGPEEYVRLTLSRTGLLRHFDSLWCGAGEKQTMAVRLKAAAPQAAWAFVGDRFIDADAARAAGMPSYFAGWGFSPKEEAGLFSHAPRSFEELLRLLGY